MDLAVSTAAEEVHARRRRGAVAGAQSLPMVVGYRWGLAALDLSCSGTGSGVLEEKEEEEEGETVRY